MTNWERYKDEMLKLLITGLNSTVIKGKVTPCYSVDCNDCPFNNIAESSCSKAIRKWLDEEYEEYEEEPKTCKTCQYFHLGEGLDYTGVCLFSRTFTSTGKSCEYHTQKEGTDE